MNINKLNFVGIPTSDQDRAIAFWTTKIGFELCTDRLMGLGQRWIELTIPGADTRIALFTPEGQEDRIGTFFNGSFGSDDVERAFKKMSARGVAFVNPPEKQPWGTTAQFCDPDGNRFVLTGP